MYDTIKFFHFFALMLGATAGFGNLAVALQISRISAAPPVELLALRPFFSKLGLGAIGLIWITGFALYLMRFSGADLGMAFYVKLLAAALIFAGAVMLNRMGAKAAAAGTPPPPVMAQIGQATSVLTLIAVALAVYVFA